MNGLHTQGWRVSAGDEHTVFDRGQSVLCRIACGGMSGRTFDEAAQIARLIAAAPDLLEVCERAIEEAKLGRGVRADTLNAMLAAIAKATGGEA